MIEHLKIVLCIFAPATGLVFAVTVGTWLALKEGRSNE